MTDSFNPYAVATREVPTMRVLAEPDYISHLDVSASWKERFRVIERAGGPKLPLAKRLKPSERRKVVFSYLGFFFGPFYFLAKGLWRQALSYTCIAIAAIILLELIGLGAMSRVIGTTASVVYAMRAQVSYYQKMVLEEAPWL